MVTKVEIKTMNSIFIPVLCFHVKESLSKRKGCLYVATVPWKFWKYLLWY